MFQLKSTCAWKEGYSKLVRSCSGDIILLPGQAGLVGSKLTDVEHKVFDPIVNLVQGKEH